MAGFLILMYCVYPCNYDPVPARNPEEDAGPDWHALLTTQGLTVQDNGGR